MGKKNKGKRQGALRTQLKTEKKEEKRTARESKRYEDDIDRVLAQIARSTGEKVSVGPAAVAGPCERPSPRAHCSLCSHPSPDAKALLLWGGEHCPSKSRHEFFRDALRYRVDRRTWSVHPSAPGAPCPLPRCSHQAVSLRFGGRDLMYLFGGEFSTPDGEKFRHFRDTWCLDLEKNQWEEIACPGKGASPTARSGHRIVAWRKQLVLFGGYFDSLEDTRYMNDLWFFDLEARQWRKVSIPASADRATSPAPRSGCQLAVYNDQLYVFGGYSREVRDATEDDEPDADDEDRMVGVVHNDVWRISLTEAEAHVASPEAPAPVWERLKLAIVPPPRTGFCLAVHKKRAFMFGGVLDSDDLDKESTFRNDLWSFNFEKGRWFVVRLREPQKAPSPRYGSQCTVLGSSMYVWGGVTETAKAEVTFDDLYELNLNKLDAFVTLLAPTVRVPTQGDEEDEEEDDEKDGDEKEDGNDEDDVEEDSSASESEEEQSAKKKKRKNRKKKKAKKQDAVEGAEGEAETEEKGFYMPAISREAAAAAEAAIAAIEAADAAAKPESSEAAAAPADGDEEAEEEPAEPLAPPEVLATREQYGVEELEGPAGLPRAVPHEPEPVAQYDDAVDDASDTEEDKAPAAPQHPATTSDAPAAP